MRTIKFRGKTINGEWFYGDLIQIGGGALIYHGDKQELEAIPQEDSPCAVGFYPNEISPVIPKTIGEFIFLSDKNGKEIFEGDIVTAYGARNGVIDFGLARFGIDWDYGTESKTMLGSWGSLDNLRSLNDDIVHELEVIGNIHDNEELLSSF